MPQNFLDAPELVFSFARQQSYVLNAQVYMIEYEDMDYSSLVPVNTSIPEWAAGMDSLIGDVVGEAHWQSGAAKDIPLADTTLQMVSVAFDMYAIGYQWNLEELGKAQYVSFPLTSRRAEAARRGSEQFIWNNVLTGNTAKGWTGLLNSSYVTPLLSPNNGTGSARNWVDTAGVGLKTPDQIVADINVLLMGADNGLLPTVSSLADTLLLPVRAYRYIAQTPYGVTSPGMTILQYVLANNVYTMQTGRALTVRALSQLRTAATTTSPANVAGQGRGVAYRNSPDVLELPLPMPYRFLPVYQDGPLNFVVPGIARVGPVDVKRPLAMRYMDGISPA